MSLRRANAQISVVAAISFVLAVDAHGADFLRGDVDRTLDINIADPIRILEVLFLGGDPIVCLDSADANDDGQVDLSDPVALLAYLFLGGPAPPAPFIQPGTDPTPDAIECPGLTRIPLGCLDYEAYIGAPVEAAIFTQAELDRLVADRTGIPLPDCDPLPAIDFTRFTLLGLSRCASGCRRNYLPEVRRDDDAGTVHYQLTVEEIGSCEPWVCNVSWVLVDSFPSSYQVTFATSVVQLP